MRIGIDARQLCGQPTGVGRYLLGLLADWKENAAVQRGGHEFVLYAPESLDSTAGFDSRRFHTRLVRGAGGTWWEQVALPRAARADRLDVFFAPQYTAPLWMTAPTVVAIHDVSFAAHPEWFRTREGARLRWLARQSAARARTILTISEFSRREIVEHLGVPDSRVRVVPPGIPRHNAASPMDWPREPRVLFVGSIFNRRHVPDLIRAFGTVARRRQGTSLDIVGDNRSFPREDIDAAIAAEGLGERIRWHRYVPEEKLASFFRQARAFAFLSEYEGLGLTPLEALGSGVPPVLLDTPIARESCGDAAIYVPAGDLGAVGRALERALFDEAERERLLAAGERVLARYSSRRAGTETLAVLEESAAV